MSERTGFALNTTVAFILVVGFSVSAMATWLTYNAHTAQVQQRFMRQATHLYLTLHRDLQAWTTAVRLVNAPPDDVQWLLSQLKRVWPATASVEWWRPVNTNSEPPSLTPEAVAPKTLAPVLSQADLIIQPTLQPAVLKAWLGHQDQLTAVTQLNQQRTDYRGEVRLLHPVLPPGGITMPAQPLAPLGLLAVSLDLQTWLASRVNQSSPVLLQAELYDLGWHTRTPVAMTGEAADAASTDPLADWHYDNVMTVHGREWLLRIRPTPSFPAHYSSHLPVILFIAGTFVTSLIALAVAPSKESSDDE